MKNEKSVFFWLGWQGVGAFCWFMWIAGSFLSYWGFVHVSPHSVWWVRVIAGGLAIGINFVEFMLNRMSLDELIEVNTFGDAVLRFFGLVCYAYDIYTNVLGFLSVVGFTAASILTAVNQDATMAVFAIFFGILVAVGPEPLYIRFLLNTFPFPRSRVNPYYSKSVTQYQQKPPTSPIPQGVLNDALERARRAREERTH